MDELKHEFLQINQATNKFETEYNIIEKMANRLEVEYNDVFDGTKNNILIIPASF